MNFEERFKGKLSKMNKDGFKNIFNQSKNPILQKDSNGIKNYDEKNYRGINLENIQRNYLNLNSREIYAQKENEFNQNNYAVNHNYQIPSFDMYKTPNFNYQNKARNEYPLNDQIFVSTPAPPMLMRPIFPSQENRVMRNAENILSNQYPRSAKTLENQFEENEQFITKKKKSSVNFDKKDLRRNIQFENFNYGGLGPNLDENWENK